MNEIKRQGTSSLIRVNDLITAFVKSQYSKVDQYKILKEINNILELEGLKSSCTQYSEILTFESIQAELSSINEKESHRKRQGVYYTPHDLVDFININLVEIKAFLLILKSQMIYYIKEKYLILLAEQENFYYLF